MDTVRLLISVPERLTPDNSPFMAFSRNKKNFPQAWLKGEDYSKKYGCYFPTVSYSERPVCSGGITHDLSIEFSVPKLIFEGNNLREVSESDYNMVITTLCERLCQMGLEWITSEAVANATVTRLDICKNILLDKESDIQGIFRTIRLGNMGGAYRPIDKKYLGGGQSFGFGIKHETVIFYDKSAELKRRNKAINLSRLFIIRFEIKISGTRLIRERLKRNGFCFDGQNLRFIDVFKKEIWRKLANDRFGIWYKTIPKIDIDIDPIQVYLNISRDESGKRGGYARVNEKFTCYALTALSGLSSAEIDNIIGSVWGIDKKYRFRKTRDSPIREIQLKLLLKLKKDIEDFRPLKESDIKNLENE